MKKYVAIIIVLILCLTLLSGCSNNGVNNNMNDRFVRIDNGFGLRVYVDTETKVMYVVTGNGGITNMIDEDNMPALYEGGTQ